MSRLRAPRSHLRAGASGAPTAVTAPTITASQTFSVAEGAPIGTLVGSVTWAGSGLNSASITGPFTIDELGRVYTAAIFDYETLPSYTPSITLTNGAGSDTKNVTIAVTDISEPLVAPDRAILLGNNQNWLAWVGGGGITWGGPSAAVITAGQTLSVNEHVPDNTTVGTVAYTGYPVTSAAIASGNTGSVFSISVAAGVITVKAAGDLNYEGTSSYTLGINATNPGGTSSNVNVTVNIGDVTEPTVNASQTFTVNASDPDGTTLGTVATSGATPTGFSIGGTGLAISSAGVVTKSGTPTTGNYGVTAALRGYTSPSVNIGVTVNASSPAFSSESGKNIVLGITAWASTTALGSSVTMGSKTGWFRTNASKLYWATSGGTTGSTAPTHTSGTASDGSITWEYVGPVDYTSIASWISYIVGLGTLTQPEYGIVWADAEVTLTNTTLTFGSVTTTTTNRPILKAKEELAFYSHASPVGRYDTSKGIAIYGFGAYNEIIQLNGITHLTVKGLQLKSNCNNRPVIWRNGGSPTGFILDRCILQTTGSNGNFVHAQGLLRNCIGIADTTGTNQGAIGGQEGALTAVNCTFMRCSNRTAGDRALYRGYGPVTAKNCIFFGYTNAPGGFGGDTITSTYCAAETGTVLTGGTGDISTLTSSDFVQSSSAGGVQDAKIVTGSVAKNAGTTDTTNIPDSVDIFGTTRSTWDIGAHEFT